MSRDVQLATFLRFGEKEKGIKESGSLEDEEIFSLSPMKKLEEQKERVASVREREREKYEE